LSICNSYEQLFCSSPLELVSVIRDRASELKVTNTSDVPITVRLFRDLDDSGDIWDANVRDSNGSAVESRWIEIGTIQQKETSNSSYWWGVFNQAGVEFGEDFEVTFKIAPQVTIDYKLFRPFSQSKSQVSTVDR
jgi:hypothetical protein